MNFSWTTRWWAFRICLSKKLLTCTAGCIIMVWLSCWLAILALQGGYLLFQNAVYLSQKKRTIRLHACTLSTYTKAWQDVTVKWEFVCNFAGGYADINPLSNLKAIIWTIKHQQILNYLFVARGQIKCFGKVSAFHTSTRSLRKRQVV